MAVRFVADEIRRAFNEDPEFRLCARFWSGRLELGVGERAYGVTLVDGEVAAVEEYRLADGPQAPPAAPLVRIGAPSSDWASFVQDPPPPFYLDYYSASHHHGFELGGDPETLWAYYPAIRRTGELLRPIARAGEDADA